MNATLKTIAIMATILVLAAAQAAFCTWITSLILPDWMFYPIPAFFVTFLWSVATDFSYLLHR